MRRVFTAFLLLAGASLPSSPAQTSDVRSHIVGGVYDSTTQDFESISVLNAVIGAGIFYNAGYFGQRTNVANVEGGHIWTGHTVFDRTGIADFVAASGITGYPATLPVLTRIDGAGASGELDFHATMVGNVLAGTGLTADHQDLSALGAGVAPLATLWSGAIATSFATDEENIGSFETSKEAFLIPYRAFFEGTTFVKDGITQIVPQADVINSSWGYDDPAGVDEFTQILDGLARANPTVTLVKSAGNSGSTAAPGGPGSGYNGITVGALGGSSGANAYLRPSDYTSSAPGDFYNPVTGVTLTGVRAAVDLAAPGDDLALAAYLGLTGSLAGILDSANSASDLFFVNESGTSFSSPIVAGAVSLLKDVALSGNFFTGVEARDTRVIKSVLMAGASPTVGWNNGQQFLGGVITTTQALDYATGAGRLNLENAALIYVGGIFIGGTADVPGSLGGEIDPVGWDLGAVERNSANSYFFDLSFTSGQELDVSLNWFVNVDFNTLTETAQAQSFANLDLEVWIVSGGVFTTLIAKSATLYNNTEFLRFLLPQTASYGLRVTFDDVAYEQPGHELASETYGLAWKVGSPQVAPVPEPGEWGAILGGALVLIVLARRRAKFVSNPR